MSNPFPDTKQDIERRAIRGELDRLREMARAIEDEANELANEITKFEDGLEERWEKEDGDTSDDSVDIPTLVRRHRGRSR
mgnify:FL=1